MKLHYVLLLFMLTSCIGIKDFGPYWDKAKPDPALVGTWGRSAGERQGREALIITADENQLQIVRIDRDGEQREGDVFARSLHWKGTTFLLVRIPLMNPGGVLVRYDKEDGALRGWEVAPDIEPWLAKHPEYSGKLVFSKSKQYGAVVSASGVMDEAFLDMLVSMPPESWKTGLTLRRLPPHGTDALPPQTD